MANLVVMRLEVQPVSELQLASGGSTLTQSMVAQLKLDAVWAVGRLATSLLAMYSKTTTLVVTLWMNRPSLASCPERLLTMLSIGDVLNLVAHFEGVYPACVDVGP